MSKYSKKFVADAFVSRDYLSAITLEKYLNEIQNQKATNYANNVLRRFNSLFKPIVEMKTHQQYYAKVLVRIFEDQIMKPSEDVPMFVKNLLLNVIKTKYKIEILRMNKNGIEE